MAKKSKNELIEFFAQLGEIGEAFVLPSDGMTTRFCNWVLHHKKMFGHMICDCSGADGVAACFLARQFPQAQITAYVSDISVSATVAEKLDLKNIAFTDAYPTGEYHTVVALDRFKNLLDGKKTESMILLDEQGNQFAEYLQAECANMASLLENAGTLISFDMMEKQAKYLGVMYALADFGLCMNVQYQKELMCQNGDGKTPAQITVAEKKGIFDRKSIFTVFEGFYQDLLRQKKMMTFGFDAEIALRSQLGELVEGYVAYFRVGGKATKIAYWTDKDDPNVLLSEQYTAGARNMLMRVPIEKKAEEIGLTHNDINGFLRQGMRVKLLRYKDGVETEEELPENSNDI